MRAFTLNPPAMAKYKNLLVFAAYLIVLKLIYSVPKSNSQFEVASWLGPKFWIPTIIFFIMGFLGIRAGRTVTGQTWRGTRFTGFVDEGAVSGSDGLAGGASLSLAYMSFHLITALITVIGAKNSPTGYSSPGVLLIVGAVMFILIIPLHLLFLFLYHWQKPISWIILGGWAAFLAYAATV